MNEQGSGLKRIFLLVSGCGVVMLCVFAGLAVWLFIQIKQQAPENMPAAILQTETTAPINEPEIGETPEPTVEPAEMKNIPGEVTLKVLEAAEVPENDPIDLAERFHGIINPKVQLITKPAPIENGAKKEFWILQVDENYYRQITTKLVYQTPHLYFWVEDGVEYNPDEVAELCNTFEDHIYPTDREYFGSEWTPGVDNDEHLVIVFARDLGSAAGYFSGSDSLTPEVRSYSNAAEMFYLSADYADVGSSYTNGVLAHEFQHMIHWNNDRNETSWVNEGLSELAVELNGYDIGGFDYYFAFDPDMQLNYWPDNTSGNTAPHYGASYLFFRYVLSKFGADTIKDIVKDPKDGMEGVDDALAGKMKAYDPDWTDKVQPGDLVFQNWTIANTLQNSTYKNGLYGYGADADLPPFTPSDELTCDSGWLDRTVSQYGADTIRVACEGNYTIEVEGKASTNLLPADPHSGKTYFWSNSGDESHMTLSREFDFTQVENTPIHMTYWTWYDIEKDYDYLYLTASTDGKTWKILSPAGCTRDNPTGANFGCGYSGHTDGWVQESVDLSSFAGQKVKLQFEYITDTAVNGEGFLLDDISVDTINYSTDFEQDNGGWDAAGFVRISNQIPQAYALAVIQPDYNPTVDQWINPSGLDQKITINNQGSNREITVVISGLTRFTHTPADYRIKVTRNN